MVAASFQEVPLVVTEHRGLECDEQPGFAEAA